MWGVLGSLALVGLVAIAAPQLFRKLARVTDQWVDCSKLIAYLDRDLAHPSMAPLRAWYLDAFGGRK